MNDLLQQYLASTRLGSFACNKQQVCKGQAGHWPHTAEVIFYLKVDQKKIMDARFQARGHVITLVTAAYLAELIIGLTVSVAKNLQYQEAMNFFNISSAQRSHVLLAYQALQNTLNGE